MSGRRFRLVVLDWDGTVMDSIGTIVECARAAAEEVGVEPASEATMRSAVGLGLADTVERLLPGADPATAERLIAAYRRLWRATYSRQPKLYPGAREAIDELASTGYLLAVATGKGRHGLDLDLEATGLGGVFHATRTADETFSKPHPRMLEELLDELGTRPAEALMVGDTRWDLELARNAGVAAVAVATGTWTAEQLATHEPLATLAGIHELPAWLRRAG